MPLGLPGFPYSAAHRAYLDQFTPTLENRIAPIDVMDLKPFELDIDELISEFAEKELTTLADMRRIWLSRKFSFIFEASPSTNLTFFMQSLYAHSIGYMISNASLSRRLGGLYCLFCLYEVQPFKPPFKIYLSLGELKRLRHLVVDAKQKDIKVACALVKKMLERNMFLLGCVEVNDASIRERLNKLTALENARVQVAHKKLFSESRIEQFISMDLGTELEVETLKNLSKGYASAKELAIAGASKMLDVENIKHIADSKRLIGQVVEKSSQDWTAQKELFYAQTGLRNRTSDGPEQLQDTENSGQREYEEHFEDNGNDENGEQEGQDDGFGEELEQQLLFDDEL